MLGRVHSSRVYNPAARYVNCRRVIVDWMCDYGEELGYGSETIHHSVAVFDLYFSLPTVEDYQKKSALITSMLEGKPYEEVV